MSQALLKNKNCQFNSPLSSYGSFPTMRFGSCTGSVGSHLGVSLVVVIEG